MQKRLAAFDLDGTLFDTRKLNYDSYQRALGKFGIQMEWDLYAEKYNGRHYTEFLPAVMGEYGNIEEVHRLKQDFYKDYLGEAVMNRHLFQMISCMRQEYYIALVTTASRKNCVDLLTYYDKLGEFDFMVTQEDVKRQKPDPEGFLKAMEYCGVSKENTVIFEDSEAGIQAGKKSGAALLVVKGIV